MTKNKFYLVFIWLGVSASLSSCKAPDRIYEETRLMWDTHITIKVVANNQNMAREAINSAFERMLEIEKAICIFNPRSKTYELNKHGIVTDLPVDLLKLLNISLLFERITDGAFNVAIQPILKLWSEGLWKKDWEVQNIIITEILPNVKTKHIKMDNNSIVFQKEGMLINFGGVAKGYAVDEGLKVIKDLGLNNAMISCGGDIKVIGHKPRGKFWTIAMKNPGIHGLPYFTFNLSNKAIATSGNYERFFSPDKKTHHIINPATGFPALECISVTIVANTATVADALATSIFVLGPHKGIELVENMEGVEALLFDISGTPFKSSGLTAFLLN